MSENKKALAGAGTPTRATETAACRGAFSCPHSTTSTNTRQVVADYLPIGVSNAVSGKELAALLGYRTVRKLSHEIELERRSGQPICAANGENKGYYMAASASELENYAKSLNRRIREIRRTHDAIRETLCRMTGQEVLKGW